MNGQPPKALRGARIVMFVQSGISICVGLALLALLSSSDVDDAGGLGPILVVSLLLSVALLVCAAMVPRRQAWVRTTAIVIESVNVASAIVGEILLIVSGAPPAPAGVGPIVLSALVIQPLLKPEVRAWFADEQALTRREPRGHSTATPNQRVGE